MEKRDAPLQAIEQPPALSRLAYRVLRESILSGRLLPGKVYTEGALAKELAISKTPVREALLELASQGLVTFLPRRGVVVKSFSEEDVEEVFEVREAIELAIVEKVARTGEEVDLTPVQVALAAQRQAIERGDMQAFLEADRQFHTAFAEMVRNRRLSDILANVRDMVHVMGMEALTHRGRPEEVVSEHEGVVAAIRAGDVGAAREAMAAHLSLSKQSVLEKFRATADNGHG